MTMPDVTIVEQNVVAVEVLQEGVWVSVGVAQVELALGVPGLQGPAGPPGPPGVDGAPGTDVWGSVAFASAQDVWEVTHGLPREPSVSCRDQSGRRIYGDEEHLPGGIVRVTWAFPMTGTMLLT